MRLKIPIVFIKPFFILLPLLTVWAGFEYFQIRKKLNYSTQHPDSRKTPALALPDVQGKLHRLDKINAPGIVVFWASWCGPCIEELRKLEKQDLGSWSYLAINSADNREDAEKFLKKEKFQKPLILFDDKGEISGIKGYPSVYASFGNGVWAGPMLWGDFDEVITEVKNTLSQTDYKPLQESQKRRSEYFENAAWHFYYAVTNLVGVAYMLILLFLMRNVVRRTVFLRWVLLAYLTICILESLNVFSIKEVFGKGSHSPWRIVIYLYYSPLFWGAWVSLGILIYLRQFVPATKPENSLS